MRERTLFFSIIFALSSLFVVQILSVLAVELGYGVDFQIWRWYVPMALFLHITIAVVLCLLKNEFRTIPQDKQLKRVNFINAMSLFRISSTPTLILFVTSAHAEQISTLIIVWASVIFISDFLDGKLARKFNQMTRIGQYIDSWSDYLILIVISVLLYNRAFISEWFFISALTRILIPILAVLVLYIINCSTYYHVSWFGRASVFAIMTVFLFSLTRVLFGNARVYQQIALILECVAIIGFIVPAICIWLIRFVRSLRGATST